MNNVRLLLVTLIFGCGISNGWSPIETDKKANEIPRKVLFIGNSYTYFNDLDVVLRKLAASAEPSVRLQTAGLTKGGATLENHYTDPKTIDIISKVKWDLIILQEQSTRPVVERGAFFEFARKLVSEIKEQDAKPVFYMTWARQHKPEMTRPLEVAYTQMGRELDAYVAPVGLAWAASLKANPQINLYDDDKSHPNVFGTYLSACVFYATLTGQNPVGLSNAGLKEIKQEQAEVLQKTAWEAVQSYTRKQSELNKKQHE